MIYQSTELTTKFIMPFTKKNTNRNLIRSGLLLAAVSFAADTATYAASVSNISLCPAAAKQGQTVEVILTEPDDDKTGDNKDSIAALPTVTFRQKNYQCFPLERTTGQAQTRRWRTLLAVPADLQPGSYQISSGTLKETLKVTDAKFPIQKLTLPKSKDNFQTSPGEEETVRQAKETVSPEKLWKGKFIVPNKARVSAGFGLRRMVNGKLLSDYFHSGIDYAGGTGSPIYATQDGKVIIARTGWKLHGNTVCIDHGQGVVSFYIHMSKLAVKEGALVKAGEQIGSIGSSGRASGPHLHFSLYVNGNAANPAEWFTKFF